MGEDMMLMSQLALRSDRVSIVSEPLYYYVKTNDNAQTANYRPEHWAQVDRNLKSLEAYVNAHYPEAKEWLNHLKLNLKLPLLISTDSEDYKRWQTWYSEANSYVMSNPRLGMRIKLVQRAAVLGQWWFVRLYNIIVTKWLYSLLYK